MMNKLSDLLQESDWKTEKHVPVIESPEKAQKGANFKVAVSVGKQVGHPNTTQHHIRWIALYFLPEGEQYPFEIGRAEFCAHGESAKGADTGGVYTHHEMTLTFKTEKPGTILASSYCNIHGLWQSAKELKLG
jgi:superoxide reductase